MTTSTNITKTCIVKVPESGKFAGKKIIFRNCESVEQAISIIKNQVFKNNPIYDGENVSFSAHTENNLYYIIEGNYKEDWTSY